MPEIDSQPNAEIGLALSGGGYRATLFHLGALCRMNELGWLHKLDRVTSVSGGSIVGAYLGYRWRDLNFIDGKADNFLAILAAPIQNICSQTIDTWAILKGKLDPFHNAAYYIAKAYDKYLFKNVTLHALPDDSAGGGPRFIIYATNLQSGVSFRFSRPYLADYRIGMNYNTKNMKISDAVAASSAFPPLLSPMVLKTNPNDWKQVEGADLWPNQDFRKKIYLADGGVYDNMGLEAVWKQCKTILASAAGAPFSDKPLSWLTKHTEAGIALRASSILVEQTRALRRRMLVDSYIKKEHAGSYWNIASEIAKYDLSDPIMEDNSLTRGLRFIRTRLDEFSPTLQGHLINWGYVIADTAIRKWVDPQPLAGNWSWPCPDYKLA